MGLDGGKGEPQEGSEAVEGARQDSDVAGGKSFSDERNKRIEHPQLDFRGWVKPAALQGCLQ